jgi:cellulose synthase/poly-beta-1,6-N-acetylglucosamine synthase-like glycosyltransferase
MPDMLILLALIYAVQMIVFSIATRKAQYPTDPVYKPTVSVIIAARNEEPHIGRCLDAMTKLTYPHSLLQVVVVDDRSEDRTSEIIEQYTSDFPFIRSILALPEEGMLRGKANAVTQGIEASEGDIIFFTDADCAVPSGWIEETVKYYANPKVGIVAGFTSLRSRGWFEAMQALDWFVLFSAAAATIRMNHPVTAVGNNLSVRRRAYLETGGYRNIPFSVTEDYALVNAVARRTDFLVRFPLDPSCVVESLPCQSWKEIYQQKKRWFTGGRDMDLRDILIFGLSFLFAALLIAHSLFGGGSKSATAILIKSFADLCLMYPTLHAFRKWKLLWAFVPFQIYYTLYILIFPIIVLFKGDVVWKARVFGNHVQK